MEVFREDLAGLLHRIVALDQTAEGFFCQVRYLDQSSGELVHQLSPFFLFYQLHQLRHVDPHHLYAFLLAELGEVRGAYAHDIVQVGACLVLSRRRGRASTFRSALEGGLETAALHGVCGEWVRGWALRRCRFYHPGLGGGMADSCRNAGCGVRIWQIA